MKNYHRSLSAVLVLLLALGILASCGGTPSVTDGTDTSAVTTEADTTVVSPYDQLAEKDFGGAVYTVLFADPNKGLQTNIPEDDLNGEAVNDTLYNRDLAIETRYNVDIQYIRDTTDGLSKMKSSVLAGDNAYNLVISSLLNTLATSATANVLANLCELPDLSLSESWWSPLLAEKLTLKGAMYVTAGDIAPGIYQSACCMFLNLDLYEDYGIDTDIYQLVLDGKWTLERLNELTKDMDNDVNNNGKWDIADDIYGIAMQPTRETAEAFIAGADLSFCSLTPDGKDIVFNSVNKDRTVSTIEDIIGIARNIPYQDINDVINITFKSGRALFLQHKLETAAVHLRDMESDYLILPDPKYDESQDHYISFISGYVAGFVGVPLTAEPEMTGRITEALARYSHENVRPIAYNMFYEDKTARDPRSAEVLNILFDNLSIDFNSVYNFGSICDSLSDIIFKEKPLVSTFEERSSSVEAAIDKFVDGWNS